MHTQKQRMPITLPFLISRIHHQRLVVVGDGDQREFRCPILKYYVQEMLL